MNCSKIKNSIVPFIFLLNFLISEDLQPKIKYLPISSYPTELNNNSDRNVEGFLEQWDVIAEYYPETF